MRKPKIFLIGPTHYVLGGVAVWAHYLLCGLEKQGYDVVFGALNGKFHNADRYLLAYPQRQYIKIDAGVGSAYARERAIKKAIKTVNPDIVLVVNVADVYRAVRGMRRRGQSSFKVVSTIHGVTASLFHDLKKYLDVIDDVIVTNKLTEKMVVKFTGLNSSKIHYAPYGVPISAADLHPKTSGDCLTILYCGRIDNEQKRCQDIPILCAELLSLNLQFKLLIVGDGPTRNSLLSNLSSLSEKHGGRDFYEYHSSVPVEDMNEKAYSRADVLFLPSYWETGPIVVWEAMSQEIPIVTSCYIGSRSEAALVDQENCLMFDIGDMKSAAKKIAESQTDDVRPKLVEGGLELVRRRYSREASIQAWGNVLCEVFAKPLVNVSVEEALHDKSASIGRLERVFGARFAAWLRVILHRPVYTPSAGDEWPHAHSVATKEQIDEFDDLLVGLEQ